HLSIGSRNDWRRGSVGPWAEAGTHHAVGVGSGRSGDVVCRPRAAVEGHEDMLAHDVIQEMRRFLLFARRDGSDVLGACGDDRNPKRVEFEPAFAEACEIGIRDLPAVADPETIGESQDPGIRYKSVLASDGVVFPGLAGAAPHIGNRRIAVVSLTQLPDQFFDLGHETGIVIARKWETEEWIARHVLPIIEDADEIVARRLERGNTVQHPIWGSGDELLFASGEFFERRTDHGDRKDHLLARPAPEIDDPVDDREVALVLDGTKLRPVDVERDAAHGIDRGE